MKHFNRSLTTGRIIFFRQIRTSEISQNRKLKRFLNASLEVAARAFSTLRPKRSKVSALPPSRAKGAPFSGLVLAATGSPRSPTAAGTPAAFLTAAQRLRRRFLFDPTVDDAHSTVQNEHNDHKRICSLMRRLVECHLLLIKLLLNRQTLSSESPINIKENARHTAHNFASCTPRKRPPSPP